jgi:hypothetical protein
MIAVILGHFPRNRYGVNPFSLLSKGIYFIQVPLFLVLSCPIVKPLTAGRYLMPTAAGLMEERFGILCLNPAPLCGGGGRGRASGRPHHHWRRRLRIETRKAASRGVGRKMASPGWSLAPSPPASAETSSRVRGSWPLGRHRIHEPGQQRSSRSPRASGLVAFGSPAITRSGDAVRPALPPRVPFSACSWDLQGSHEPIAPHLIRSRTPAGNTP